MEHSAKRVKLTLEPVIEKIAVDIGETGHEVYKTELSLSEQLMRNVDRVWVERGDWKDITEEGLHRKMTKNGNTKDTATATDTYTTQSMDEETIEKQSRQPDDLTTNGKNDHDTAIVDEGKLRESVISKLYFAKCEIDVALDVINILATENKPSMDGISGLSGGNSSGGGGNGGGVLAGTNGTMAGLNAVMGAGLTDNNDNGMGGNHNLVLPPGTLHATYVSKPKPTEKEQLEQAQLTLGLKRTQQKTAANYLKKSAASLKKLVDQEQHFWDQAVHVRSNHWLMQASSNIATGETGLLISYGFKDAGSHFAEISHGEMVRSYQESEVNKEQQVQLSLPHNIAKQIQVTIKQNQLGQMNLGAEATLGLPEMEKTASQDCSLPLYKFETRTIQRQLIDAQSTVYDAELFSHILSEAQVLPSNIQCEEECVMVTLDGQIDIIIQKIQLDQHPQQQQQQQQQSALASPLQQLMGRTIGMALRLLLIQHHRFNVWKSRTRLMSRQRKTQQFLNSIGDTTSIPGSATGTPGSSALINNPMTSGVISTGSNMAGTSNTSPGGTGSSSTPIISHRAVGNVSAVGGTSASSSSMSRQLTSGVVGGGGSHHHHHHTGRDPSSDVPILSPVISMTRFWILFDRICKVVHNTVDPLCGETGLGLAVHYKSQHVFNHSRHYYCDAYPYHGDLACSLAINVLKGPSLQFALNQSGTIIATLPGNVVALSNVMEFEAFLLREINLICLHMVCDIANDMIQRSTAYKMANSEERSAYIWQVDEVEEILYGAVRPTGKTADQLKWKNIQVYLNKTATKQGFPAYVLQFKETSDMIHSTTIHRGEPGSRKHHLTKRFILLSQWQDSDTKPGLIFRNKVAMMIQQLLE